MAHRKKKRRAHRNTSKSTGLVFGAAVLAGLYLYSRAGAAPAAARAGVAPAPAPTQQGQVPFNQYVQEGQQVYQGVTGLLSSFG